MARMLPNDGFDVFCDEVEGGAKEKDAHVKKEGT